jgi:hypothetical protein
LGWLNFFKRRESGLSGNALRDVLFDAAEKGDKEGFDRTCRVNSGRILAEFKTWLKGPEALRADPKALTRYGQGLIAVAEWFARNGEPQLEEAIQGKGRENPMLRWQDRFGEADKLKIQGRFTEAIEILEDLAEDMSKCRGSAVEKYLPMVQGSLGESSSEVGASIVRTRSRVQPSTAANAAATSMVWSHIVATWPRYVVRAERMTRRGIG